jgi:hypothetical protein
VRYLAKLKQSETPGAQMAVRFLDNLHKIGQQLVSDGVAANLEDVNAVLQNGFYLLYGVDL